MPQENIPERARRHAKSIILDSLGIALGSTTISSSEMLYETVKMMGGAAESNVIGWAGKFPACSAAMVNGSLIHASDFDDTHIDSVCHVSSCVLPAALAMTERAGADGQTLLSAFILGSEAMIRVGLVAGRGFDANGFHATAYCGVFGAAASAAYILHLTADELTQAFGIAATFACGSLEYLEDGSWTKRLHPGWAAHSGIMAVLLAQRGYTGPRTAFEGRFGLFPVRLPKKDYNEELIHPDLEEKFHVSDIAVKKYPTCHINAAYIDAIFQIKMQHGINKEDISKITCYVNPIAGQTVCEPQEEKRRPSTAFSAKFSLPFSIALAVHRSVIGLDDYETATINDLELLRTVDKVHCIMDPTLEYPGKLSARLLVQTKSGALYPKFVEYPDGSAHKPMSDSDLGRKFLLKTQPVMSDKVARDLMERVLDIDTIKDISKDLMALAKANRVSSTPM